MAAHNGNKIACVTWFRILDAGTIASPASLNIENARAGSTRVRGSSICSAGMATAMRERYSASAIVSQLPLLHRLARATADREPGPLPGLSLGLTAPVTREYSSRASQGNAGQESKEEPSRHPFTYELPDRLLNSSVSQSMLNKILTAERTNSRVKFTPVC